MKKTLRFSVAAAAMGVTAAASAGYFEIGTEVEDLLGGEHNGDFVMPYVTIGGNPIEGNPFRAELKTSYLQRTDDSSARERSNRSRSDITFRYTLNYGNFTFVPGYRLRQDLFSDRRDYEHRFYPNTTYRVNDTFSLQLDGFVAPVQKIRASARGSDAESSLHNYTDYRHEFDMRLNTRLSETQRLTVSVFTEYRNNSGYSLSEAVDHDKTDNHLEWQLRAVYSQNFGDLTLTPFFRFGLSRDVETVDGTKLDERRNRFGLEWNYKLTSDLSLNGETYYQSQNRQRYVSKDVVTDRGDQNKMMYRVGVRYTF